MAARQVAGRVNLGEAGQAGDDADALRVARDIADMLDPDFAVKGIGSFRGFREVSINLDLDGQKRPGSDKAHVADQDVEQLGQFVHGNLAHTVPNPGYPGIILVSLAVDFFPEEALDHGPEFDRFEDPTALADPALANEYRKTVFNDDQDAE